MRQKIRKAFLLLAAVPWCLASAHAEANYHDDDVMDRAEGLRNYFRESLKDAASRNISDQADSGLLPAGVSFAEAPEVTHAQDLFASDFNPRASLFRAWTPGFLAEGLKRLSALAKKEKEIDLQFFLDVNLRAVELWEALIGCAGGDEEAARHLYATGDFQCRDGSDGEALQRGLTELHVNVLNFIQTSEIGAALQALSENGESPLIPMHPLLAQVYEEIFAAWFPFGKTNGALRDWLRGNAKTRESFNKAVNMLELLPLLPMSSRGPVGLWPTAIHYAHAYTLAKITGLQDRKMQVKSPLDQAFFFRAIWNGAKAGDIIGLLIVVPNVPLWAAGVVSYPILLGISAKSIEPSNQAVAHALKINLKNTSGLQVQGRKAVQGLRRLAKQYGITESSLSGS